MEERINHKERRDRKEGGDIEEVELLYAVFGIFVVEFLLRDLGGSA